MKFFISILLFFVFLEATSLKNMKFENVKVDKITSIYDGDTFRVNIKEYSPIIGERIPIRINGIDTPEMRGKCVKEKTLAREAKQLTVSLLRTAKTIELKNIQRGKYFRIVADVYADNQNLAYILIKNKLAVKYDGGTKIKDWCK